MDKVRFQGDEFRVLELQAREGERAREVFEGDDYKWIKEIIFGAIYDQAIMVLRNAKTEEDRVKAQQMFLACEKPQAQIQFLISQGDAARASLEELATTLATNEEEQNA